MAKKLYGYGLDFENPYGRNNNPRLASSECDGGVTPKRADVSTFTSNTELNPIRLLTTEDQ
jgi:hypothetical protein